MEQNPDELHFAEPHRYDPMSYDSVLSKINIELTSINRKLDDSIKQQHDSNIKLNQQIASLDERIDKRITDLEKRVISLEYYKYWLLGATAVFGMISGYFFNKIKF